MESGSQTTPLRSIEDQRITPSYYCAGAIRGDISYERYIELIRKVVRKFGEPYSEKSETYVPLDVYDPSERASKEKQVYERDMYWLRRSRAIIAEISGASSGTGFEIREAIAWDIPVYCVYINGSHPSLILKQCLREYRSVIVQEYNGEHDLEAYVTLYMYIANRTARSSVIRRVYLQKLSELQAVDFQTDRILGSVDKSLAEFEEQELETDVDFQDQEIVIPFMVRNMVLQIRWERLMTQKIGETFVSASLPRVIRAVVRTGVVQPFIDSSLTSTRGNGSVLDKDNGKTLVCDYDRLLKLRTGYKEKALVKNLKAFSTIGLLVPQGSHKSDYLMRQTLMITEHCKKLSVFLEKYGNSPLRKLLTKFENTEWNRLLAELGEVRAQNIDEIKVRDVLQRDRDEWRGMFVQYLNARLSAAGVLSKKRKWM